MNATDRDDVYQQFIFQLQTDRFLAEEILNMEHRPRSLDYGADCQADIALHKRISRAWEADNYEAIGKLVAQLYDEAYERACEEAGVA